MPRRTPLVCQHLESIARSALEDHQAIIKTFVRGRNGIYALYRGDKLYYVGLASNLRTRLAQHLRDRHGVSWDRFSIYLTIGDSHLKELEALVLRIVRPSGNRNSGRFAKSQNLHAELARSIRHKQRLEITQLLGRQAAIPARKQGKPTKLPASGRQLPLARFVTRPFELRARFKGELLRARVRRDGGVRFAGRLFTSPSLAAAMACGRETCNGWVFWTYERAPGDWVVLDQLRR